MKRDEDRQQLRAGLFLAGSVLTLVMAVLLIGRSQTLFAHRLRLTAEFANTSGLVVGAPVRLAGVDVGVVQAIRFTPDLSHKLVRVTMAVDRRFADRIRADSVARLTSKGLLGDVIIDVTVGSAELPRLGDGERIPAQESEGMAEVLGSLNQAVTEVRSLAGTAEKRLDAVFTDELGRELVRVARSAGDVMEQVERGDGLAHSVIYDRKLSREAERMVGDGQRAMGQAAQAIARADTLLATVQNGEGTLHGLLYRNDGGKLLADLSRTTRQLGQVIEQVQNGRGTLHTLLFDGDGRNLVENLTVLSRTLRQLGDEAAAGKGTIGALLKDPSIYEDLKGILGSVQRSRILRGLIRYTIRHDHLHADE